MQRESATAPAMPQFDAMDSETEFKAPPRDYAADFIEVPRRAIGQEMAEQGIVEQEMAEQLRDRNNRCFLRRPARANATWMFLRSCAG